MDGFDSDLCHLFQLGRLPQNYAFFYLDYRHAILSLWHRPVVYRSPSFVHFDQDFFLAILLEAYHRLFGWILVVVVYESLYHYKSYLTSFFLPFVQRELVLLLELVLHLP
jgi:hypothetical protein